MSTSFEAQGIIHSIGETTEYGNNGFTKREFVLKLTGAGENEQYPNYIAMELVKDKCALMDSYKLGDEIVAHFNLQGRLWQGQGKPEKCFNSLQAWRVESANQGAAGMGAAPVAVTSAYAPVSAPNASAAPADPFNTHFSDDSAGLDDIPF